MKKISLSFALLSLCLVAVAANTKIGALVKAADKFDGKSVTTAGTVTHFQAKTSKKGNKYFVFELEEGSDTVNLYGRGELKAAPHDGQKVQVSGKFEKEHKLPTFSVKNQITIANEKDIKVLSK